MSGSNLYIALLTHEQTQKVSRGAEAKVPLKLTTPVIHVYNVYVYCWRVQLKVTSDRLNIEAVDRHFMLRTDEVLERSEYQCAIPEARAIEVFEERWTQCEKEYQRRLNSTKRMPFRHI